MIQERVGGYRREGWRIQERWMEDTGDGMEDTGEMDGGYRIQGWRIHGRWLLDTGERDEGYRRDGWRIQDREMEDTEEIVRGYRRGDFFHVRGLLSCISMCIIILIMSAKG